MESIPVVSQNPFILMDQKNTLNGRKHSSFFLSSLQDAETQESKKDLQVNDLKKNVFHVPVTEKSVNQKIEDKIKALRQVQTVKPAEVQSTNKNSVRQLVSQLNQKYPTIYVPLHQPGKVFAQTIKPVQKKRPAIPSFQPPQLKEKVEEQDNSAFWNNPFLVQDRNRKQQKPQIVSQLEKEDKPADQSEDLGERTNSEEDLIEAQIKRKYLLDQMVLSLQSL